MYAYTYWEGGSWGPVQIDKTLPKKGSKFEESIVPPKSVVIAETTKLKIHSALAEKEEVAWRYSTAKISVSISVCIFTSKQPQKL